MPAMWGVAKLLPVARSVPPSEPREVEVEAAAEELDRRRGVVVEGQPVGLLVAPDRDDAREAPREALHGHVVGRGDEKDALEVGAVGELVETLDVLRPGRREAHVHDREPLLDRPGQPVQHGLAAALVAGAEDADARQLDVGRERAHDPGAGRAVPAEVALVVVDDLQLALLVAQDRDRVVDAADERMVDARCRCRGCRPGRRRRSSRPTPTPASPGRAASPARGSGRRPPPAGSRPGGPPLRSARVARLLRSSHVDHRKICTGVPSGTVRIR